MAPATFSDQLTVHSHSFYMHATFYPAGDWRQHMAARRRSSLNAVLRYKMKDKVKIRSALKDKVNLKYLLYTKQDIYMYIRGTLQAGNIMYLAHTL